MKRIGFSVFLLLSSLTLFSQTLKIGIIEYPPYEYSVEGDLKGISFELVVEIFKKMNQPIEFEILPWKRALLYLELKKIDGLFQVLNIPKRTNFAIYTKEVLMNETVSLFCLKTHPIYFDGTLESIKSYRMGLIDGFSYGITLDTYIKNQLLLKTENADNVINNLNKLLARRIEIIPGDKYAICKLLIEKGVEKKVWNMGEIEITPAYFVFAKKKGYKSYQRKYDAILNKMKASGEYDRIIETAEIRNQVFLNTKVEKSQIDLNKKRDHSITNSPQKSECPAEEK